MNQYKIYEHPSGHLEVVKQGWSWPAFFFTAIWALVKKMWVLGGGLSVVTVLFALVTDDLLIGDELSPVDLIGLPIGFIFGVMGNGWWEESLVSRGYELRCSVEAGNRDAALTRAQTAELHARLDDSAKLEKLDKLAELLGKGALTDAEFEAEKRKILSGSP